VGSLHVRFERSPPKKLIDAARYWVLGSDGYDDQTIQDLMVSGAPDDVIESVKRQMQSQPFVIHADCWTPFDLFQNCDTQWRFADGIGVGLDFTGVLSVMKFLGLHPNRALFEDLKTMERAALSAAAELRKKL